MSHSCLFQDYELQLASYSSGLETLLKIPIKRTMLQSPATVVRHEVREPSARAMNPYFNQHIHYNTFETNISLHLSFNTV